MGKQQSPKSMNKAAPRTLTGSLIFLALAVGITFKARIVQDRTEALLWWSQAGIYLCLAVAAAFLPRPRDRAPRMPIPSRVDPKVLALTMVGILLLTAVGFALGLWLHASQGHP